MVDGPGVIGKARRQLVYLGLLAPKKNKDLGVLLPITKSIARTFTSPPLCLHAALLPTRCDVSTCRTDDDTNDYSAE